jgi:glycosyltransferase involved in cell wall biosynthesis
MASISVIIPTYNRGNEVCLAVQSVLDQTLPALEVIVVDDGSTDDTPARLSRFDGLIRYVVQTNRGPASARNHGAEISQGEWIAFLDSDDVWAPDKLERQSALIEQGDPRLGVVHCDNWRNGPGYRVRGEAWPRRRPLQLRDMLRGNPICTSAVLIRRQAFVAVGGFEPTTWAVEDWDLWLRLLQVGWRFATLDTPLVEVRLSPTSLSLNRQHKDRHARRVLNRFFGRVDLPNEVRRLQSFSYACLELRVGARESAVGHSREALRCAALALRMHPALGLEPWGLSQFARIALSVPPLRPVRDLARSLRRGLAR